MHNVTFFAEKDLPQGTDEWKLWRETVCSASDACIVMEKPRADGPQTWRDLRSWVWEEPSEKLAEILMHGSFNENEALKAWNRMYKSIDLLDTDEELSFEPISAELHDCLALGASYDGVAFRDRRAPCWVEIKCPAYGERSEIWKEAEKGRLTSPVYWQMAHQFLVINSPLAIGWLFVYIDDAHFSVVTVDEDFFGDDLNKLEVGWRKYMSGERQVGDMFGIEEFVKQEERLIHAREQKKRWANEEQEAKELLLGYAEEEWSPELHDVKKYLGEYFTIRKQIRETIDKETVELELGQVPMKSSESWVFARARKAR